MLKPCILYRTLGFLAFFSFLSCQIKRTVKVHPKKVDFVDEADILEKFNGGSNKNHKGQAVDPKYPLRHFASSFIIPKRAELSSGTYRKIEKRVFSIPKSSESTVQTLANYLTVGLKTDRQKAYALYLWMTHSVAYDAVGLAKGQESPSSSAGVLIHRKSVCAGYSTLFAALGKASGLKVIEVGGYAKGFGFGWRNSLTEGDGHAWNAIFIGKKWHLIDSTWGAGHVSGKRFTRKFSPYYFLTPPRDLIYSHFPEKQKWQLLKKPITRSRFLLLPQFEPAFFKYGLKLLSPKLGLLSVRYKLRVALKIPRDTELSIVHHRPGAFQQHFLVVGNHLNSVVWKYSFFFHRSGNHKIVFYARKTRNRSSGSYHTLSLYIRAKGTQALLSRKSTLRSRSSRLLFGVRVLFPKAAISFAARRFKFAIEIPRHVLVRVKYQRLGYTLGRWLVKGKGTDYRLFKREVNLRKNGLYRFILEARPAVSTSRRYTSVGSFYAYTEGKKGL
jgi:hypothetical protein